MEHLLDDDGDSGSATTPWAPRYVITRSPKIDIQQSRRRAISWSSPQTLVKVWFIPTNDASARSSVVADERTATRTSRPRPW